MIVKSVTLPCGPERAFALFTEEISQWWPADRRHTNDPESKIILSRAGRFYECSGDGAEVELGAVRVWDAPRRLVLDWYPGTDAERPTSVEVTFSADGDQTRVQVEHGPTAASEQLFAARAPRYQVSWDGVLAALSAWTTRT